MNQSAQQGKAAQKVAKKVAKAALKTAKKHGKAAPGAAAVPASPPGSSGDGTVAERAARAAERKALWEQRRFWLMVVSVLIAVAALLIRLFGGDNS